MSNVQEEKASSRAQKCNPTDPHSIPGFSKFGYMNLKGVDNARDLGGIPTEDGRRIKRRRLMRSGDLHDATSADMKQLIRMHDLEYVVDFRTPAEVEQKRDPLPMMQGIEYVNLPVLTERAIGIGGLNTLGADSRTVKEFLTKPYEVIQGLYPKCVLGETGIATYSRFLNDLLMAKEGATLWHCTQGKDRTGLAAVLVEYSLGVPMQYIKNDYLATNLFIRGWVDRMKRFLSDMHIARGLDNEIEAYGYASMCYLDAGFAAIKGAFGSLDNYLEKALDFGRDKQRKLQELYLE